MTDQMDFSFSKLFFEEKEEKISAESVLDTDRFVDLFQIIYLTSGC